LKVQGEGEERFLPLVEMTGGEGRGEERFVEDEGNEAGMQADEE
jgi:hypothetical protein